MTDTPNCELCGEPMPPGETMFKFHGYSGPCPKPPLPKAAPEAPAATTCDCGKTPEACAATEDCSGQSMPAAAHERERAAVEFAANYRIWQNELSRTPSDETLRTAATYNKTLAFNKFIAADNAYLAASGRGKS